MGIVKGVLVLLLLLGMGTTGRAVDDGWDIYGNARFGFFVCYPRNLLRPQGESDNGDGNTFKTRDGKVTVTAAGMYSMAPDGGAKALAEEFHMMVKDAESKGYKINYTLLKPQVYAYSGVAHAGTPTGEVTYEKTFETADHRDITLHAEYPESMKATMDPVVARMASCLRAGKIHYGKVQQNYQGP